MPFPGVAGSAWALDTWVANSWDENAWAGNGVVPPEPAQTAGGGWVREDELEKFAKRFHDEGRIRAVASPAVAFLDGTVQNPTRRQRPLPRLKATEPAPILVPTAVVARMECLGSAGMASIIGQAGLGNEDFDYVRRRVEEAVELGLWDTAWEDL